MGSPWRNESLPRRFVGSRQIITIAGTETRAQAEVDMSRSKDSQGATVDYQIGDLLEYVHNGFVWRALFLNEISYDEQKQERLATVLLLYLGGTPCVELLENANVYNIPIISRL